MIRKSLASLFLSAFLALTATTAMHADAHKIRRPVLTDVQKEKALAKLKNYKNSLKAAPQSVITPDPALGGWWQMITRGDEFGFGFGAVTDDIDSYIYIDISQFDPEEFPFVIINTLCGTPVYPRECTTLDVGDGIFLNLYYVPTSTQLVNILDVNGPAFDPTVGQSWWSLQLQPDSQTLTASSESQPSWVGYNPATGALLRKVDGPQQPVRPFNDTDSAFPDVTNPVEIAKYIRNSLLLNHNQPQNVHFNDGDYLNFYDAEAIFQKMLDDGITYESKIRRMRVSVPGEHYVRALGDGFVSTDRLTDIFTEGFSFVTTGATVKITGFKGKWQKLNGTYVNGVAIDEMDGIPNPSPQHVDASSSHVPHHGSFRNVYNHFLLDFDSSDKSKFPRDDEGWAKDVEGDPVVKVTYRFTPDMQYPEFFAAIRAMFFAIYKVSSHNAQVGYFKPGSMFLIDTWDELKEAAATDAFWGSSLFPGDNLLRTRTTQSVPSGFYNNVVLAERGVTTYNDPFKITQKPGSKYDYNIVLSNYIVLPKNVYWAIRGTPTGPTQFDPTEVGYKPAIPGPQPAEFVGALGDIIVVNGRPQPQNPDPTYYSLLTNGAGDDVRDSNSYYVGLINPSLTNGKRVGYMRFVDEDATDPLLLLETATFPPNVPVTVKYGREADCQVMSNFTRYLQTDLDCDAVIIDIRTNNGGFVFPNYNLAEFFGDDRAATPSLYSKKDDGNSQLIDLADSSTYSFFNNNVELLNESFGRFYVQQNEANYGPGAVFKGSAERPKKVIILTDNVAASSGDMFPHYFLGENLDGNLGSFTTGMIIGDIDGRLKGSATYRNPVPVSKYANFLFDADGNPFPPIRFRADLAFGGEVLNGVTDIFYNQQVEQVAPSFAPSLKGTAGGAPLPNDWHNTVWPDLGLIKAPDGHFSKHFHREKPCPNDPRTWCDSWLDQAILVAIE